MKANCRPACAEVVAFPEHSVNRCATCAMSRALEVAIQTLVDHGAYRDFRARWAAAKDHEPAPIVTFSN